MSQYVVGIDGAAPSRAALDWALRRSAGRTRHPLRLVHVLEDESAADGEFLPQQAERGVERLLTSRLDESRRRFPGLSISSSVLRGSLPVALSQAAGPPDMLVLGTHRGGSSEGGPAGERSVQVASTTSAMLAVIPDGRWDPGGPVVVGIGMREPDGPAVVWAAHEAAANGVSLLLVHGHGPADRPAGGTHPELAAINLREAERLARQVQPELDIAVRLSAEGAAEALLEASRTASLLVIGPPLSPAAAPAQTEAVTRPVLLGAECPVVVARYRAAA